MGIEDAAGRQPRQGFANGGAPDAQLLHELFFVERLPLAHKIFLENLLRFEDGRSVTRETIAAVASGTGSGTIEIAFRPARVLLQDFTGVPALADLAAMRDAVARLGGAAERIDPQIPAELVIDHSVQVDAFGAPDAFARNTAFEMERNRERYAFLKWGAGAFSNLKVVPPGRGICHQVNLEYLARVVCTREEGGRRWAFPDTLVGTDSHTPMVNGLGVLGFGVGGIEAEAALLGRPISLILPPVVGVRLEGELREGVTATDLVLVVTHRLREQGVVGKIVEFFGDGLDRLSVADRATLSNMAPEYGATCGLFPVDENTLRYLELTGRDPERRRLVEAYAREQGLFRFPGQGSFEAAYQEVVELDLERVEPCIAGPRRPQDRISLSHGKRAFEKERAGFLGSRGRGGRPGPEGAAPAAGTERETGRLHHGSVVIAAITSCTNTSNPSVMAAAGLLAKRACERGLSVPSWVKTSFAPGSRTVTRYLERAGLLSFLEKLGFHLVGYGCTTCIGNSGPLPEAVSRAIHERGLLVCSVLSGNRNFEGRIHPEVRMNYLASPPLVVAYALAGRMDMDFHTDPLGFDRKGMPVFLRDLWPGGRETAESFSSALAPNLFEEAYGGIFHGDASWEALSVPEGLRYAWDPDSTYILEPPFFKHMSREPSPVEDIHGARVLVFLGDSVTTDHISPAGVIPEESPAGRYLLSRGVLPGAFNTYGARRGNHEVMMRGAFANVRLRNRLVPGREGGFTPYLPSGEVLSVYDAAVRYGREGTPLVVLAGKEYGTGSSRDWAAKGPALLGVRAVLAESFERIHRSNLVGMGILPLEFTEGAGADALRFTGEEVFHVEGVRAEPGGMVRVTAEPPEGGAPLRFEARVRIDTPEEAEAFRHGGILHYAIRELL